jgi:hypothetical protein
MGPPVTQAAEEPAPAAEASPSQQLTLDELTAIAQQRIDAAFPDEIAIKEALLEQAFRRPVYGPR